MNIFVLDKDPVVAAQMQCDKHVVKMIVESAQMLSTAHRILDGEFYYDKNANGRKIQRWRHPIPHMEWQLYKAVHMRHPCTLWTMESSANYSWHFKHFIALCEEYTHRYHKKHKCYAMRHMLGAHPDKIPEGPMTPFKLAMGSNPECMSDDPVESYRKFYMTKQARFSMDWSYRGPPDWFLFGEVA